jgi:hypothetical protein
MELASTGLVPWSLDLVGIDPAEAEDGGIGRVSDVGIMSPNSRARSEQVALASLSKGFFGS